MICIEDIAHSLANTCRFRGHTKEFYSVAQHSILVAKMVCPELSMAALLHDAAESYIGDMSSPIKQHDTFFQELEAKTMAVICERFELDLPFHSDIHSADIKALSIESVSKNIMVGQIKDWGLPCESDGRTFEPWPSKIAEDLFLENYRTFKGAK
jgi:hypothetical protein